MKDLQGTRLLDALESGSVRVAEPVGDGDWQVHPWIKEGILEVFRTHPVDVVDGDLGPFLDKRDLSVRRFAIEDEVRMVPGGSAVRRGAHVAQGVVLMPPCYVNIGAFVDRGAMIDSHALVGSCAQVGRNVHLAAGAQLGGVLEPVGSRPVIVEDDAWIGALCGVFEGTLVRSGAVLAAGTVLTASTRLYDLVEEREIQPVEGSLEVPPGAVVVPGNRPAGGNFARELGLTLGCALIVKYRDASTDGRVALEEALR